MQHDSPSGEDQTANFFGVSHFPCCITNFPPGWPKLAASAVMAAPSRNAFVVASLIRGIVAFMKSTKIDLESGEQTDATDMQLMQNKMMFARIKYQALAVVVVAVILAVAN